MWTRSPEPFTDTEAELIAQRLEAVRRRYLKRLAERVRLRPREETEMKITRQARILLNAPGEGAPGGYTRALLATELADALNRLVATLPPEARVEPSLQTDSRCMMGAACALAFSWEEELPSS